MYILYYINICSFMSSNHNHQFWGPIRRTNYFTQVMKDLIKLCLECYKVVTLLMLSVVISIQRPPICGDRWLRCYLCEELLDLLDSPAPDLLAGGEAGGDTHLTSWSSHLETTEGSEEWAVGSLWLQLYSVHWPTISHHTVLQVTLSHHLTTLSSPQNDRRHVLDSPHTNMQTHHCHSPQLHIHRQDGGENYIGVTLSHWETLTPLTHSLTRQGGPTDKSNLTCRATFWKDDWRE